MSSLSRSDKELREQFKAATKKRREAVTGREVSDEEVEVLLARIADRLDGYTHDEVVARNPLPDGIEEVA